ncbi:hypothetical protein MSP8887_02106 [Marinomonas spartinae]|uniref:hypothetical protein n=1 Tax=Marinomonas spartinae TaxID=1792290 RepID=UPI000808B4B5|nr:hypothetical protein [Marinomonas spartinae]SBS34227.1 hypothetical protein MSP8887_02106 [Marinomonas spartinae]
MIDKKQSGVMNYLMSPEARLTIIIPILIYNIAFWWLGAGMAVVLTACYSGLLEVFSKRPGSFSIISIILVSGIIHYFYLNGYSFFGIDKEGVFLSVGGAISVVLVFSFYSLIGRPVIRTQAENAMPRLTQLSSYGTPKYCRVWQEISLVWVLVYIVKAVMVIFIYKTQPSLSNDFVFVFSWPLTLIMIAFSIYWPKLRWSTTKIA